MQPHNAPRSASELKCSCGNVARFGDEKCWACSDIIVLGEAGAARKERLDRNRSKRTSRRRRIRRMIAERSHFEDRGYKTPCRIWDGGTSGKRKPGDKKTRGHSYPRMNLDGGTVAVHKAVWTNAHGIVPPRKQIDHLCSQRDCIREDHLELVTHKTNQKRRDAKRKLMSSTAMLGTPDVVVPDPSHFVPNLITGQRESQGNILGQTYVGPFAASLPDGSTLFLPKVTITPAPESIDE